MYDIAPALRTATANVATLASSFGTQTEVYNGVDLTASVRLGRGVLVSGGASTGRIVTDACFVVDSPQGTAGTVVA